MVSVGNLFGVNYEQAYGLPREGRTVRVSVGTGFGQ
jgi:hypothetical protein